MKYYVQRQHQPGKWVDVLGADTLEALTFIPQSDYRVIKRCDIVVVPPVSTQQQQKAQIGDYIKFDGVVDKVVGVSTDEGCETMYIMSDGLAIGDDSVTPDMVLLESEVLG